MFSVKDYANEMGITVQEVLNKCAFLEIKAKSASDILEEDDVIMLDNAINIMDAVEDTNDVYNQSEEEEAMVIDEEKKDTKRYNDKNKKASNEQKINYAKKRKEMYKHKEKLQSASVSEDVNIVLYKDGMRVSELADALNIKGNDIIVKLMGMGLMISLNETVDFENAEIIALEYGKTLKREETQDVSNFEEFEIIDNEADLVSRPPVVTIMGHVDHGKTTLLDYIRNSNVVDKEAGGITQHIGAYQISYNDQKITFIDTPGHAAFTEMRARGASITDIVIIIVAADDGVMPQTEEAIDHALSAGVPIIVAVNKIDKPEANVDRIITEMAAHNITAEAWGGNIPFVNISAKTGENVDKILETIIAISEMNEYRANPNRYASGTVIESRIDKANGGVTSLLIQNGTLRLGDPIVVGTVFGKVRTIKNDLGVPIVEAGPSMPVEITGLNGNPSAGDKFMAFENEHQAKEIAQKRAANAKITKYKTDIVTFDDLFSQIQSGVKEINVLLKADVRGSEEAVKNALLKIDVEGVKVKVIRSGIGAITESDVVLANASNAVIIGFNVVASTSTKEAAKEYSVEIRQYTIIYKLVEDMEAAMKGMLDPEFEEKVTGTAEIRQLFKFSKVGTIAGCKVIKDTMKNGSKARIIRDGVIIYDGVISSIQREKDSVKEVKEGYECGITIEGYNDLKEGDLIESYEMVEVKR
ncbi:MAG TPA: translation initiation factor IF-2 [Firmicutes bacterium]|nr:translation initiation factor IF-2 [Bacillota bacterium]